MIRPVTGVKVTDVTSGASVAGIYQNSKGKLDSICLFCSVGVTIARFVNYSHKR